MTSVFKLKRSAAVPEVEGVFDSTHPNSEPTPTELEVRPESPVEEVARGEAPPSRKRSEIMGMISSRPYHIITRDNT